MDFDNFWQECLEENWQFKDGIIFQVAWSMFLHYIVKLETRKLHLYIRLNEFPVLQGSALTQIIWDEKLFIYFLVYLCKIRENIQ